MSDDDPGGSQEPRPRDADAAGKDGRQRAETAASAAAPTENARAERVEAKPRPKPAKRAEPPPDATAGEKPRPKTTATARAEVSSVVAPPPQARRVRQPGASRRPIKSRRTAPQLDGASEAPSGTERPQARRSQAAKGRPPAVPAGKPAQPGRPDASRAAEPAPTRPTSDGIAPRKTAPEKTVPDAADAKAPSPKTAPDETGAKAPSPKTAPDETGAKAPSPKTAPDEAGAKAPSPKTAPDKTDDKESAAAPDERPAPAAAAPATDAAARSTPAGATSGRGLEKSREPALTVPPSGEAHHGSTIGLMLGTLGVVYGDIGTSPLYAIKECFSPESPHHVEVSRGNVLGVLSLIFWSLFTVVAVKYLTFIMRADNEGQGGILALLALVPKKTETRGKGILVLVVLFGAALLYGDGVITPAISVLSAVEGLAVQADALEPLIVPLTAIIIFLLFFVQRRGTGGIGKVFGPVMLVWFLSIAALGAVSIAKTPGVVQALNPVFAVQFFLHNGGHGFLVLGSVVLCITGGEALYADMGHFGRRPIRATWYAIVMPCLLLNYFGQGALLLRDPSANALEHPFYSLVPNWGLYPMVAVATIATVVASQALISGAFSLTQQAIQLGYLPRMTVVHTHRQHEGQIYIPEVNNMLLAACLGCVFGFGSSTKLAAAYGIAVTGTMGITTIVYYVVVTKTWGWSRWKALPLAALFLVFDCAFFGANVIKFLDGGWFPIAMAVLLFTIMTTWKAGRAKLWEFIKEGTLPIDLFLTDVQTTTPHRVRGTAVFMSSNPGGTPPALLHHFKHNQVLHDQVVLLSVLAMRVPEVPTERRLKVEKLGFGFFRVTVLYGFMQSPKIPQALAMCAEHGLVTDPVRTSYVLGREVLLTSGRSRMWRWRKWLFAFVSRNALPATAYFGLPPNRVVELGIQIDF